MNDLLTDSFEIPRGQAPRGGDIELGLNAPMDPRDMGLDNFFKQIDDIEKQIEKLSTLLKKLQDANEESKAVTKAASMKAIKQRMEKDVDEVGKIALSAKSRIEQLDKENLTNRQKPGCGKGTGVDRTRTARTVAIKKKLKDKMSEFQILRQNIQQEYREVVERRVFTVTGKAADEETIDRLIETGDSEQIFQKAIQEQGRGQIMDTLAEIQERHDAVRDVERKLLELQQVFLDMAVLVEAQGDMLDNIESQVSTAVDHVQSGNTALQKAKKLQKNSRKWMCIAIIILLLIVAIIVVAVIKPWNSNKVKKKKKQNILAFDLIEEEFGEIPLPRGLHTNTNFKIKELEGCLCGIDYRDKTRMLNMWKMEDYYMKNNEEEEEEDYWKKILWIKWEGPEGYEHCFFWKKVDQALLWSNSSVVCAEIDDSVGPKLNEEDLSGARLFHGILHIKNFVSLTALGEYNTKTIKDDRKRKRDNDKDEMNKKRKTKKLMKILFGRKQ